MSRKKSITVFHISTILSLASPIFSPVAETMSENLLVTTVHIFDRVSVKNDLIPFHIVDIVVLISLNNVEVECLILFHAVVTKTKTTLTAPYTISIITFQFSHRSTFIFFIITFTLDLITF